MGLGGGGIVGGNYHHVEHRTTGVINHGGNPTSDFLNFERINQHNNINNNSNSNNSLNMSPPRIGGYVQTPTVPNANGSRTTWHHQHFTSTAATNNDYMLNNNGGGSMAGGIVLGTNPSNDG